MKILKFTKEADWLDARRGRVTGTRAGNFGLKRGGGYKKGFYEVIAERVAVPRDDENVMDRGKRIEEEAVERFAKETGKKVQYDKVLCVREDDPNIAFSPDALIGKTESIEVKCLNSPSHIEAYLTKKVPSEYEEQYIQPFVVNDSLKTLYFVFYDPSMPKDFFFFEIHRKDVKDKIEEQLGIQRQLLAEIAAIEAQLTF